MWRNLLLGLLLMPLVSVAEDIQFSAGIESFRWEEFDNNGRKLLTETGIRYVATAVGKKGLSPNWATDFGGRLYSGTVDYDGETWGGSPVSTDTVYNGYQLEVGLTHLTTVHLSQANDEWQHRIALGVESWYRDLQNSALSNGTLVTGYEEHYTSSYTAISATYVRNMAWAFSLGMKLPLLTTEELMHDGLKVTLHPEGQLSMFAGLAVPINSQWNIDLSYDSYRFAKSDPQSGVYQPESHQTTFGAAVSYRF